MDIMHNAQVVYKKFKSSKKVFVGDLKQNMGEYEN